MSTYSINPGSPTEAYKLNSLQDVMNGLPDNLEKLVSPHDLRNATFTVWENIILKETIISGLTYTGYNDFPGQTISQKIYIGKKQRSGLDIMTDALLNSDTDLFFYNNKKDSNTNQNTKISILAGTTVSNFPRAPYIEARQVTSPSTIDLYITNTGTSSKIAIDSPTVNIKDLNYPSAIGSPNTLLRHDGAGNGMWASPTVSSIIAPGVTVSIIGSPVLVNGFPLEYTNSFPSQITVGGILVGTTFSTVSFVDMFNKLFYPYLVPVVSLTASVLVYEYGSTFIPQLYWNIQSKTNAVTSATLSGVIAPILAPPTIPAMTTTGGALTSINITTTNPTTTWILSAFDGTASSTTSITANRIYPFFYGMSTNNSLAGVTLYTSLTKDVSGYSGIKTYTYTGNNKYSYFVYPVSYGLLTQIQDENLNTVYSGGSGSFTYSIIAVSSTLLPNNYSTNYYAYKTNTLVSNYGYPFTFIF